MCLNFFLFSFKISFADDIPIIVIAPSKIAQSYSTVGTSVTSLSNKEIQENGKFFLGEVLNDNLPGMNYFRSGGYGTVSGIQLRGLPKRYSTVYIDGVKMSDPSSSDNSFYFSNIMKITLLISKKKKSWDLIRSVARISLQNFATRFRLSSAF